MRGRPGLSCIAAVIMLAGNPPAAGAQTALRQNVILLPLAATEADSALAGVLDTELRAGIRLSSGQSLLETGQVRELVGDDSIHEIVSGAENLRAFAERTGVEFLVGGVLRRLEDGRIELSMLLFSRDEKAIRNIQSVVFDDEEAARSGARTLCRDLTHPRNYSPADTSFFYSLFVPGLGQLNQGRPYHAIVSGALVIGALLYGATAPHPDQFAIRWDHYRATLIPGTNDYRFLIQNQEVHEGEFYQILSEARKRNIRATAERRTAELRAKRAGRLLVGAYLFNLLDTLLVTKRRVDPRPFFISLDAISNPDSGLPYDGFQLTIGLRIR